jgi:HEAT repeat protein
MPADPEAVVARLRDLTEGPRVLGDVVALGPAAVSALERLLRGRTESVSQPRCLAADALALIGGEGARAALVRALADALGRRPDPVLRQAETAVVNCIAEHLGALGERRATDLLLTALDAHPYRGCVRALGRLREPRAIPRLVECLNDDLAREVAREALRAFGREPVPRLAGLLGAPRVEHGVEGSSRVAGRAAAATLLGELGGPEAVAPLGAALNDAEREVRVAAAVALVRGGVAQTRGPALAALLEALGDERWERAEPAIEALVELGAAAPLCALARRAASGAEAARRRLRVIETLGRMPPDPGIAQELGRLARVEDARVRAAAVAALGRRSGPAAVAGLGAFAGDPEGDIRLLLATALERQGVAAAGELARLLGDRERAVRAAATAALRAFGAGAAPALRGIVANPAPVPGGWRARQRARHAARRLLGPRR